jgi:menaquinone-9 beta-reductase
MPSRTNNPDVVVVGAGIAGASIAAVLARGGLEVLLLERQSGYRDRVRGEYMAPWGVLEARALGLEDAIRSTQAADARYSVPYDELSIPSVAEEAKRDNSTIFPDVQGPLCASHPRTCQALAEDAVRSGAELVCGVAEVRVQTGNGRRLPFIMAPPSRCVRASLSARTADRRPCAGNPAFTSIVNWRMSLP